MMIIVDDDDDDDDDIDLKCSMLFLLLLQSLLHLFI